MTDTLANNDLLVTSSPHLRNNDSTRKIMLDVIIALIPAMLVGIVSFGSRALTVVLVTILSCVLSEFITRKILKKTNTIGDLSAVVTGLLLALNLPSAIPFWIAAVGGAIAIVIVKEFFGGIGQNFMNPALVARVFLLISWPVQMTKWVMPGNPDTLTTATPLAILKAKEIVGTHFPSYTELFIGNIPGCIGETSVAALLLGGIYLLYKRVITIEVPLTIILSLGIFVWILGGEDLFKGDFIYHILSGGLIIGAFFMATDYSSTPVTFKGRIIMGIGCGVITAVIRLYTSFPEGISFAIILMNIVSPLIDRYTVPKSFGGGKVHA